MIPRRGGPAAGRQRRNPTDRSDRTDSAAGGRRPAPSFLGKHSVGPARQVTLTLAIREEGHTLAAAKSAVTLSRPCRVRV